MRTVIFTESRDTVNYGEVAECQEVLVSDADAQAFIDQGFAEEVTSHD